MKRILPDEINLLINLDDADDLAMLQKHAYVKLGISHEESLRYEIKRRSIDARRGRVRFLYTLGLIETRNSTTMSPVSLRTKLTGEPVIIVGAGPAGIFCAYELARHNIPSIICDRGKMVQARRKDLKGLNQHGVVNVDSNYCFGEGGAGTYSDGKLYTRSHKRGSVRDVLEILVGHGAKSSILTDARPHIGSNQLPKVVTALREDLEQAGVQFIFDARMIDIVVKNGLAKGVVLHDERIIEGRAVVLATGHSARDVYELLEAKGVSLEAKPFAMGVRIEHPQTLINQIQYGKFAGHAKLPPAYYRLAHTPSDGRGAFSFCMCPGGWIVPASTNEDGLVVNGMSLSKRDSAFANSGLVVAITPEDLAMRKLTGPLAGIHLQYQLERTAKISGGSGLVAPATRALDFVNHRFSRDMPSTSYLPGLNSCDLHEMFRNAGLSIIAERLKDVLRYFDRIMPGYLSNDAVMIGVESRTSSPVRIVRNNHTLCSSLSGLYPCGEGGGHAGGIMSAAMDGIKIAQRIVGEK